MIASKKVSNGRHELKKTKEHKINCMAFVAKKLRGEEQDPTSF